MNNIIQDVIDSFIYFGYVIKSKSNFTTKNNSNNSNNIQYDMTLPSPSGQDRYKDFIDKIKHVIKRDDVKLPEEKQRQIHEPPLPPDPDKMTFMKFIKSKRFLEIIFLLGGASFISFYLRTLYFGKTIRAIEIPDGNLMTLVVRSNNYLKLKKQILHTQDPIFPGVDLTSIEIKASAFIEPHFTEPILTNKDVRMIQDGSFIVWTKGDIEIPRTAVALKSLIKDKELFMKFSTNAELDKYIKQISLFGPPLSPSLNKKLSAMHIIKSYDPTSLLQQWKKIYRIFKKEKEPVLKEDPDTIQLTGKERDQLIDLIILKGPNQDDIVHLFRKHKNNLYQLKFGLKQYSSSYIKSNKSH
ncbi:hypothetical protein DLAC_05179 [Tieghemostelium lacteum]|uniref:Uncharacterized protein n=1 Tax=Tieghemostelium lacteum TaxID=361077 RepID=A0A151ZIK2_TIELA|nr:hypothetical protein DLAC_05179 [Tieghemostelium lacteum]|eukprot:KYQ93786.1 hypothetical protein DLAC_05179 [Tieghemostelium lacteum]